MSREQPHYLWPQTKEDCLAEPRKALLRFGKDMNFPESPIRRFVHDVRDAEV